MNYLVLNGIKSTTVKGLIIQSLPPISKPLIRTQIDVIDGRDGDIVTPLGYSADNKAVTIGLHGDFNIDSVISYFNTSGTVIFSNEPDKYYKYAIYAQIDFERLIRFKTATVTFHVQPFKYSSAEKTVTLNNQLLTFSDTIKTVNGVTAAITNGVLSISGTASADTVLFVPVPAATIGAGSYILRAYATGTNAENCTVRLIYNDTSTTFGNNYITLQNNAVVSLNGNLAVEKTYNYLYFTVAPGDIDITVTLQLAVASNVNMTIRNNGNYSAKPQLTVYGCGVVNLSLNGSQMFVVNLAGDGYITIDAAKMDAYQGSVLKNRSVTGDYNNFSLPQGVNYITYTGMVTRLDITNYSRWL